MGVPVRPRLAVPERDMDENMSRFSFWLFGNGSLLPYRHMEAGLFGLVFDEDFARTLMIEKHLSENKSEVVFVHKIARNGYFVISHIRKVKGRTEAMTTLRDGIDVSASLEELDIFLRTENRGNVKPVMRQVVAA